MWVYNPANQALQMAEGDFGVALPITVNDVTFTAYDELRLFIKTPRSGKPLVDKTFSNITKNTIQVMLTEEESKKLPKGDYVYVLDWYQSGTFLCNIILGSSFKVVSKG